MIRIRVIDFVQNPDGSQAYDENHRPIRNGGHYQWIKEGKPYGYLPGDVFEMPDALAEKELKNCGPSNDITGRPGRGALLERESDYLARLEKQKVVQAQNDEARTAFSRMSEQLEQVSTRAQSLQRRIVEHEQERLGLDEKIEKAKAEVPADVAAQMAEMRAEIDRLKAAQAAPVQASTPMQQQRGQRR